MAKQTKLTRADKMNAVDDEMIEAIIAAGQEVAASDARVVVLSGKPSTIVDTVDVDLGPERDQIRTKSDPKFFEYRNRVMDHIMR